MKKLSKKRRAELLGEFDQYTRAIEFSECQIRKLIGEQNFGDAAKERERRVKLEAKQREIGALL